MTKTNAYRFSHLLFTVIATFLDLLRVSFFNKTADTAFLVITLILEALLFLNIYANYLKYSSIKLYMMEHNGFAEIIFIVCNLFSSSIIDNILLQLTANFFKIINAMRVSEILQYLQNRWKEKMFKKYEKEREKIKTEHKQLQKSLTRRRRKSMEKMSISSNKVGQQLREKYTANEMVTKRSQSFPRRASVVSSQMLAAAQGNVH